MTLVPLAYLVTSNSSLNGSIVFPDYHAAERGPGPPCAERDRFVSISVRPAGAIKGDEYVSDDVPGGFE